MSIAFIIGWVFTLASWIPKSFIKDERTRLKVNLALATTGLACFITDVILTLTK